MAKRAKPNRDPLSVRRLWRDRVRPLFTQRIKLPGWAAMLVAVAAYVPDWHSRIEFWWSVAKGAGGHLAMLAAVVASPYFTPALFVGGLLWVLFVGEPAKGVQRHHWLRYVGWSIVSICLAAVIVTAASGAIEFYIQQQISVRDRSLQEKAATKPVFWRLTEAERTALAFELGKVPEGDRFEIKFKCLTDASSRVFTEDMASVMQKAGWKVFADCLFNNLRPDLTGLHLSISKNHRGKNVADLPKDLVTLLTILRNSNITLQLALDDLKDDEFFLAVGNTP